MRWSLTALVSVVLAACTFWIGLSWIPNGTASAVSAVDRDALRESRIGLERRMAELRARSQSPGSVLACLDVSLGEKIEAGCERSVFSSPENVATAAAFAADRLGLLADLMNYNGPRSAGFARGLDLLKRGVERDRYGLVAKFLASEAGCTADKCDHLALLSNPTRVQSHLEKGTFDGLVTRYAAIWHDASGTPAQPSLAAAPSAAQPSGPTGVPLPADYVLPSSESIPAISIMNSEPVREKPGPKSAAAPDEAAPPPTPPQRATQTQTRTRSKPAAQPPLALQ